MSGGEWNPENIISMGANEQSNSPRVKNSKRGHSK